MPIVAFSFFFFFCKERLNAALHLPRKSDFRGGDDVMSDITLFHLYKFQEAYRKNASRKTAIVLAVLSFTGVL